MILGGFHIKDCPENQYQFMIDYLKKPFAKVYWCFALYRGG